METAVPFRPWRYAPTAGELTRLVAPPYDVIGPELQSRLYARDRHNVVRVDLGMTTPSDNECDDQYTRAAAQLMQWKESGILIRDADPSVTFVVESFTGPDGLPRVRHGFLALMRLYDFEKGIVFPHEQTFSGPKEDRYRLMLATEMSLSPVFFLYDLPEDEITRAWEDGPRPQEPAAMVTDDEGTITKLWPASDPPLLRTVEEKLTGARFVIADGHHRYETALRYRNHRREQGCGRSAIGGAGVEASRPGRGSRPAYEYALAYFANMSDPGLAIYGTHRLIAGLDSGLVRALPQLLGRRFAVEQLTAPPRGDDGGAGGEAGAAAAQAAVAEYLRTHPRGAFGLWGLALEGAYGLVITDTEAARMATPDRSPAYQELDVTILHTLILEKILGISPQDKAREAHVTYCKDSRDAFARLAAGESQVGFFMNPTGLDQIQRVALGGERMPQKATFFYPKLPTGLVFHDLTGPI